MKNVSRTITVTKALYRAYNPATKSIDLIWTPLYDVKPSQVEKELKKHAASHGLTYLDTEKVTEPENVTPTISLTNFINTVSRYEDFDSPVYMALFDNPFTELSNKDGKEEN